MFILTKHQTPISRAIYSAINYSMETGIQRLHFAQEIKATSSYEFTTALICILLSNVSRLPIAKSITITGTMVRQRMCSNLMQFKIVHSYNMSTAIPIIGLPSSPGILHPGDFPLLTMHSLSQFGPLKPSAQSHMQVPSFRVPSF